MSFNILEFLRALVSALCLLGVSCVILVILTASCQGVYESAKVQEEDH